MSTFFLLFLTASAFYMPPNSPDGVYLTSKDEAGNDIVSQMGNITASPDKGSTIPSRIKVRQDPGGTSINHSHNNPQKATTDFEPDYSIGCLGSHCTPDDYAEAIAQLKADCGNGLEIETGQHFFSKVGHCIAFVCNYGGNNDCAADEAGVAYTDIGKQCLDYQTGE